MWLTNFEFNSGKINVTGVWTFESYFTIKQATKIYAGINVNITANNLIFAWH